MKKEVVKKKRITNKPSIHSDLGAKMRTGYSEAKNALSWRQYNPGKKFIEKLCEEIYEWAKLETSTDFLQFYFSWGIPSQTFHKYRKKNKDLDFIHGLVKEILGWRRQKLATHKKYECNFSVILQTLRMFHPDWAQVHEEDKDFKLSLSKDEQNQKPTNITVVMKSYEDEDRDANKA